MGKIKRCGGVTALLMSIATIGLTNLSNGQTVMPSPTVAPTETPTPIAYTTLWKIKNMTITGESPDKKFSLEIYTVFTGTPTNYKICAHSLRVLYNNAELENPVVPTGLSMFYADVADITRWDNLGYFYLTPMFVISGVIVELGYEIMEGTYASQGYTSSLLPLLSTDGEQLLCRLEFDVVNDDTFTLSDAGIDWDKASHGSPPHFDSTVSNKAPDGSCKTIANGATYEIETQAPTPTPTETQTMTPTPMPTATPTWTPTSTPTGTPTPPPTSTPSSTPTTAPTITPAPGLKLEAKILLEGPYTGGTPPMHTILQGLGYLPAISPYPDEREVDPLPPNVVDWVYIKIRDTYREEAVAERSVFVRNDGRLIDDDGNTVVNIEYPTPGNYYLIVEHRNHLAIMSSDPINLTLDSSILYDFTDDEDKAYGNKVMKDLEDGNYALVAGDVAPEFGIVDASDRKVIADELDSTGYILTDITLNGVVDSSDWTMCDDNCGRVSKVPKPKIKK